MGFFSGLAKAAFDVATAPIEIVKDVVTLGGAATGNTVKRAEQIAADLEEARDGLDE